MTVRFSPSFARGEVWAPPSKSMAHRGLIAAAMADGESFLSPIAPSQDMLATMDALNALGARFSREKDGILVRGIPFPENTGKALCCRESGSTLRFLLPLCLLTGEKMTFLGAPRLMERPLFVYEDLCRSRGFLYEKREESLTVQGKLTPGRYCVPGDVSSQFITGLLFALSLLPQDSCLVVTGKMESESYVSMTLFAMEEFGVKIHRRGQEFYIPGGQRYTPRQWRVEGDFSNAAFLDGFNLLGGDVKVLGLRDTSLQGDRVYREHFAAIRSGCPTIDLRDCPDLAPVLFALASYFYGARFTGTARLRLKESDRALAMKEELAKCGVEITVMENEVLVPGGALRAPTEPIFSHNDHRIAMAMALLLSRLGGEICGAGAVSKSYPEFFETIWKLGIEGIEDETE